MDPVYRRAALIATAVTVPFVIVVALVIGALTGSSSSSSSSPPSPSGQLPPISVAAPPPNAAADSPCTTLLSTLPLTLSTGGGTLAGRPAQSTWTYVAAWGDPAVVARCGVPKPAGLVPGSDAELIVVNSVGFFVQREKSDTVWTSVDRPAFVELTVPNQYEQVVVGQLANAIRAAMPTPVCSTDPSIPDPSKLCSRRA